MKRFEDFSGSKQYTMKGWMQAPICIFAICWAIAFLVDTIAIDDRNANADSKHTGPVPERVIQFTSHSYLVQEDAPVSASDICLGGSVDGSGVAVTTLVDDLDGTYVECYTGQEWNVSEEIAKDQSFGEALGTAISKSAFIWTGIVGLLVTLWFPIFMGLREMVAIAVTRKQRKADAKVKYDGLMARYRALQSSYSKDEIDDLQFDKKLQELVSAGLNLPDRDIFKP
jgi:hypothetical protein